MVIGDMKKCKLGKRYRDRQVRGGIVMLNVVFRKVFFEKGKGIVCGNFGEISFQELVRVIEKFWDGVFGVNFGSILILVLMEFINLMNVRYDK